MNKKRLFVGIVAAATALTMCFAFSACNNHDGTGNVIGDNSVTSEVAWVQAFENTVSATNFKFVNKTMRTAKSYNGDGELVDYVMMYNSEAGYDGAALKSYIKYGNTIKLGNDEPIVYSGIRYFEVFDSTFIRYNNEGDNGWNANTEEYDTADEAKESFKEYAGIMSLITTQYKGTGDNEDITGSLDELYSLFNYDSKTYIYSAVLRDEYDNEITFEISFAEGKFFKAVKSYVESEDNVLWTTCVEGTITYGGVSITIPQGAKDAL